LRRSGLRVPLGWAFGGLVVYLARPTLLTLALGLPLALVGELIRLWASAHIEKTKALATGGPYAHSRNPLYVGSVLMALGVCIATGSPWVALATLGYFLFFYPAVIREEAGFLREKFGQDYATWARDVPAFVPRLTPGGPRTSRFAWARIRQNREWRTALALPVAALLLYGRSLLPF
jgi:protein-S-isoprenylcysteine O-methyltransferase Ste14